MPAAQWRREWTEGKEKSGAQARGSSNYIEGEDSSKLLMPTQHPVSRYPVPHDRRVAARLTAHPNTLNTLTQKTAEEFRGFLRI